MGKTEKSPGTTMRVLKIARERKRERKKTSK